MKKVEAIKLYGLSWYLDQLEKNAARVKANPEAAKAQAKKSYFKYHDKNKQKKRDNIAHYKKTHLWYKTLAGVWARCHNPKCTGYARYGGKGIKTFLRTKDVEYLWFRDRAYEMKRPSIDRIDPTGDYVRENCRYLELTDNVKRQYLEEQQ